MTTRIREVLNTPLAVRDGRVVPEDDSDSIVFRDGAVRLDATYVYADLADSSGLAQRLTQEAAAAIIRSYVNGASHILTKYGGAIRSFDGDRVMAIFVGSDKNTRAVRAGLAINWAVNNVIKPGIASRWSDVAGRAYNIGHAVGIDTGSALIVRGGARDNSDLISVGAAPNVAARFSSLRGLGQTITTQRVYDDMETTVKAASAGQNMWTYASAVNVGGTFYNVLHSAWLWEP